MAKAVKFACSLTTKLISGTNTRLLQATRQCSRTVDSVFGVCSTSRAYSRMAVASTKLVHSKSCLCAACTRQNVRSYSTEVEKELSQFLDKEIQFESSRSHEKLPKIQGFDIKTDGGDVTLTKTSGREKIVVKLSVNGAVDSFDSPDASEKENEPPQMVCRPPFHIEITKDGTVLALQCAFPSPYNDDDVDDQFAKGRPETEESGDLFEVEEVAIHNGEWNDSTFTVSSESMDPELFDLLMDMLDERGINEAFTHQLIDFCTAYESRQYVNFLQSLKQFAEK